MIRNFSLSHSLTHSLSLSFYLPISLPISISISPYIYLSLPFSLSLTLSTLFLLLSTSHWSKKRTGPQSLIQIWGYRGSIVTVNLAVCKDVTKILEVAVGHAHWFDDNWDFVFVLSLHRGGSHGGWIRCWRHWRWRLFEVGSLRWYGRWKKTRPCVSLSRSDTHCRTEQGLMNARALVMPFKNAGIIKSRWYPQTSSLT